MAAPLRHSKRYGPHSFLAVFFSENTNRPIYQGRTLLQYAPCLACHTLAGQPDGKGQPTFE